LFKSFFKGLLFDFDQLSNIVVGNYEDMISHFDDDELYSFSLRSQSRVDEIKVFLSTYFGKDYYTDELNSEIQAMVHYANLETIDAQFSSSFQGKQIIARWNLLTATYDYVKQFLGDDGVDSAFFYKLYKSSLKRCNLNPMEML